MLPNAERVIKILKKAYPVHPFAELNGTDPYRILISCILSLRTQDAVSLPATVRLFGRAKSLQEMAKLNNKQIEKLIYPVGFYRNKAQQIVQINRELIDNHNSTVPNTLEGLLQFKGVGRKTANLVLSLGFNIPAICVDIHVHRISNRLAWVNSETPEETEMQLMQQIDDRHWIDINHVMVLHGQRCCKPRNPKCDDCPVVDYCPYPTLTAGLTTTT